MACLHGISFRGEDPLLDPVRGLVQRMKRLAENGENSSRDDGCRVVFGLIRDCAFKIEQFVKEEQSRHGRSLAASGAKNLKGKR